MTTSVLIPLYIFKKILRITKSDTLHYRAFSDWRPDRSTSIVYFILAIVGFVVPSGSYAADVLTNVITISTFIFFIFGLSFADFILKAKMKNNMLRKVILVILTLSSLFAFGMPFIIISIAGATDGCFDLRKKILKA